MAYTPQKILTFETFLDQYCDNFRYELADGELVDRSPTGPHETVSGKLATQIGIAIAAEKLPWFIPLSSCTILNKLFMNRHLACSTIKFTLCGTGILPVKREWCKM
jgi:Uma2 family endonuclease